VGSNRFVFSYQVKLSIFVLVKEEKINHHENDSDISQPSSIDKESQSISIKTDIVAITLLLFFFSLLGTAISLGYAYWNGIDLANINEVFEEQKPETTRHIFLVMAAIHQVFTFLLPCLFFWILFKRKTNPNFFQIQYAPAPKALIFSFLLLLLSMPLVQLSFWLNELLPLPEWAHSVEDDAAEMISGMLSVEDIGSLLFNLLVVALIPAVGEELFFRGIVQKKAVQYFKNPHFAIWLGAFFFSAFHFQLEGLFPRMVLGAVLGYLYYWTNNLWIPILLHLFNNASIVIGSYSGTEEMMASEALELTPLLGLMVLGALLVGGFLIRNKDRWIETNVVT